MKLISEIPSEVMKWIGGPGGHPFGDEDVQSAGHHVAGIIGNIKAAGQAGYTGAQDAAKKRAEAAAMAAKTSGQSGMTDQAKSDAENRQLIG